MGHLPWRGAWAMVRATGDDPCPFSGAGLALKQKLNLIHCQWGCSFRRTLPSLLRTLLPSPSRQRTASTQPSSPPKAGLCSASLMLPLRAQGAQLQHGFTPSSILIFNGNGSGWGGGGGWGHFCLSLGSQLCVYPFLRGLG